ncbi:bestrophin family ion channel [Flavitalea sp. BT771]|uniref:bestrophin family protein n=1 Tax=Flavitalea sp. BT771 TaxID=3063329 RepID=UPI0026E4067F|nr:bestrophin family ion channel [Flavitalea sp. BT771]MDO6433707.1 bestrophin family ion channel [Flavitalea sp. BT771]MDV6222388.1 bestrophin family ion channel [Flavitalea sp. BT771]
MLLKKNIPIKYIMGKIRTELILLSLYAMGVAILYKVFQFTNLTIPLSVPMIMGTVISLLLAFRSNQAYDRWWEARTIWGSIVNDSRSLARQINWFTHTAGQDEQAHFIRSRFIKRQIAWCYSLSRSLRGQDTQYGIEKFISRSDMQHIKNFNNTPMAILDLHGQELQKAYHNGLMNSYQQVEIDRTLSRLCDAMGKCERIKNTIFPATYSLYIHFSLLFFFLLLPFAVVDLFGFMSIPVVIAIGAVFFLIEKMAIHLQDPFENKPTDTPMTAICFTIERDLKQMISDVPHYTETAPHKKRYYVL